MPFIQLPPDRAEQLIRLQTVAVTRLTRAALPGMVKRDAGAIVNVSSLLAFSAPVSAPPLPFRATYAATKAYINTFTELLARELAGTGVKVQALCPGVVRTEFHAVMGVDNSKLMMALMEPADVVAASLRGLELNETICAPALDDPAHLDELGGALRRILEHSASNRLASRFR